MSSKLIVASLLALLCTETNAQSRTPNNVNINNSASVTVSGGSVSISVGGVTKHSNTFTLDSSIQSSVSGWVGGIATDYTTQANTKVGALASAVTQYNSAGIIQSTPSGTENAAVQNAFDGLQNFVNETRGIIAAVKGIGSGSSAGVYGRSESTLIGYSSVVVSNAVSSAVNVSTNTGGTNPTYYCVQSATAGPDGVITSIVVGKGSSESIACASTSFRLRIDTPKDFITNSTIIGVGSAVNISTDVISGTITRSCVQCSSGSSTTFMTETNAKTILQKAINAQFGLTSQTAANVSSTTYSGVSEYAVSNIVKCSSSALLSCSP